MKACIVQPLFSADYSLTEEFFQWEMDALERCDESLDLIVLPESCDVPCLARTEEEDRASVEKYNRVLLEKCAETAKRCNAVLFVNGSYQTPTGSRNTTYAFNRQGEIVGHYFKEHPTHGEIYKLNKDGEYSWDYSQPTVVEIDGLRYGFLTCYDFYFYELYPNLARQNLDIIIGCSHQRSDLHSALEMITAFCAYHTNTYVVRSSVTMGEDSPIGGCSMIAAPDGQILVNLKSQIGMATCEFDPKKKYYKAAGYGNPPSAHYEYIDLGRRPWKYRPAGSAIVRYDSVMKYPRVCAHRGFNTIAPENSMPAFGAAIGMGAEEIEFDLWTTKDGEIVSLHDASLERVSDGTGYVWDYTYEELKQFDFGAKFGEEYRGLRILRFEDILKKFACHAVMNIHVKTRDNTSPYDENALRKIIDLIDQYDCRRHVYFMSGNPTFLRQAGEMAPDIVRCVGAGDEPWRIVDRAIEMHCEKVQLFKPYFNQEMIDQAHANGIKCNVFFSDDPEETEKFLDMGIDCILTNDYNRIANVVQSWKETH